MIKKNTLFKNILLILLMCSICLTFSSCTIESPEDEINLFLTGLQNKQEEQLIKYVDNDNINSLLNMTGDRKIINSLYKNLFKNFTYEIIASSQDGDSATVTIKIKNTNFKNVIKTYNKKATNYIIDNMYSKNISKKKLNKQLLRIFASEVKSAIKDDIVREKEIKINLVKNEEYGYDVIITDELMSNILGGLDTSVF